MINYYKMSAFDSVYLPIDCWSEVLSFVTDAKDRFQSFNNEQGYIYKSKY